MLPRTKTARFRTRRIGCYASCGRRCIMRLDALRRRTVSTCAAIRSSLRLRACRVIPTSPQSWRCVAPWQKYLLASSESCGERYGSALATYRKRLLTSLRANRRALSRTARGVVPIMRASDRVGWPCISTASIRSLSARGKSSARQRIISSLLGKSFLRARLSFSEIGLFGSLDMTNQTCQTLEISCTPHN